MAKKANTSKKAAKAKAAKTVKKLTKARGTAELVMPLKHATADEMLERMFELKRMMESGGAKFSDIKKKFKVSDAQAFLLIKRVRAGFHIDATGIGTGCWLHRRRPLRYQQGEPHLRQHHRQQNQ